MHLTLWQVDAFADKPLQGNPAAIIPLESWLDAPLMRAIALENNLSETAFFVRLAPGQYQLRWFTPLQEVDLCGHATLASAWVIFHALEPDAQQLSFQTRSGILTVIRGNDGKNTLSLPNKDFSGFMAPQLVLD